MSKDIRDILAEYTSHGFRSERGGRHHKIFGGPRLVTVISGTQCRGRAEGERTSGTAPGHTPTPGNSGLDSGGDTVSLTQATLQDAYDHMFGSGALSYSWLLGTKTTGVDFETRKASDEWSVEVTCENGDGGETTVTVDPAGVIRAAVAEFERSLIIERTQQGLIAARARGHMGGRSKSYTEQQCQVARMLRDAGEMTDK